MLAKPSIRHAYVQAEVVTALAVQIRLIRQQRGWTQQQLAKRLGTTQAAVSRLEDPSYGRVTLRSLLDLSKVFDTGLQVRFVSTIRMLRDTWNPNHAAMRVDSFEDEAPTVGFVLRPGSAIAASEALPAITPSATQANVMVAGYTSRALASEDVIALIPPITRPAPSWSFPIPATAARQPTRFES